MKQENHFQDMMDLSRSEKVMEQYDRIVGQVYENSVPHISNKELYDNLLKNQSSSDKKEETDD